MTVAKIAPMLQAFFAVEKGYASKELSPYGSELRALLAVVGAAQALVDYEQTGGPEYREWDQHYAALKAALKEKP